MNRSTLVLMAAVALCLRLLWIFSVDHRGFDENPWLDDHRARGLIEQGSYHYEGIPTAFYPVGYPLFLSLVYRISGPSLITAKIANAILGTILCLITALIAKDLFNPRTGIFAGWLMVFYPNNIFYSSMVMSEVLLATLLAFTVFLIISSQSKKSYLILCGILLGLCILVRPVSIILPVCILIYWIWMEKTEFKKSLLRFALLMFWVVIVLCPWIIRNYKVMNHFVLVSTNGGVNFWMAHVHGGYAEAPKRFGGNWFYPASSPEQEVIAEQQAYREAFEYLKQNPLEPLKRFPKKLIRFLYADIDGLLNNSGFPVVSSISDIFAVIPNLPVSLPTLCKWLLYFYAQGFYMLLFITTAAGMIQCIRTWQRRSYYLIILIVAWTLFHTLIFFPLGRYRFPLMSLFVVFSAFYLAQTKGDLRIVEGSFSKSGIFRRKTDQ